MHRSFTFYTTNIIWFCQNPLPSACWRRMLPNVWTYYKSNSWEVYYIQFILLILRTLANNKSKDTSIWLITNSISSVSICLNEFSLDFIGSFLPHIKMSILGNFRIFISQVSFLNYHLMLALPIILTLSNLLHYFLTILEFKFSGIKFSSLLS